MDISFLIAFGGNHYNLSLSIPIVSLESKPSSFIYIMNIQVCTSVNRKCMEVYHQPKTFLVAQILFYIGYLPHPPTTRAAQQGCSLKTSLTIQYRPKFTRNIKIKIRNSSDKVTLTAEISLILHFVKLF